MKFWKSSKIIRAISETEYLKRERMRSGEGPSGISRNSPVTVVSDSDSDSGLVRPLVSGRRRSYVPAPPELSDSDSNPPHPKSYCPHSKITKMFSELKDQIKSIDDKVQESSNSNKTLASLREMFTCLICRSIVEESSRPVMLPCCRSAICCHDCISRWLETSPICPHCREAVQIENCTPQPILRPMFNLIQNQDWTVSYTPTDWTLKGLNTQTTY